MDDQRRLQAVLDAPEDDAPRLAYAEWCDRQRDARGEFIRFQIEQAEGKRPILDLWPGADFPKLRAWAEPVWPLVTKFTFRRGLDNSEGVCWNA